MNGVLIDPYVEIDEIASRYQVSRLSDKEEKGFRSPDVKSLYSCMDTEIHNIERRSCTFSKEGDRLAKAKPALKKRDLEKVEQCMREQKKTHVPVRSI